MAIKPNLEKLREQFKNFQEKGTVKAKGGETSKNKVQISKDKDSPTKIRFLCFSDGEVFKEFEVQYKVDVRKNEETGEERSFPFLCPRANFNEDCAIREFAQELWDSKNDATRKKAKDLWPSRRYCFLCLERGDENSGPKVLEVSKTAFGDIFRLIMSDKYKEDGGFIGDMALDMDVWQEEKPGDGRTFWVLKVDACRRPTAEIPKDCLLSKEDIEEKIMNSPELDPMKMFRRINYKESQEILERYLKRIGNYTLDRKETERYGGNGGESKPNRFSEIDEKFSQMRKLEQKQENKTSVPPLPPIPDDEDIPF